MYSIDSTPHTQEVWIYDLQSQMKFTLVENPLQAKDLQDFLKCYC
ncbi:hypothetical protein [Helicobacter pametensis]|nr:hypothetical protein [Helicobacter pametensis]